MSVLIGSARGDEYGHASGGKAGDQKQTGTPDYKGEVSRQEWYPHSKGWVLIRFNDPDVRAKIARDMEYACDNPLIGYDQGENESLRKVSEPYGYDCSKVKKPCETDCARLVRVCLLYAGIECHAFYTGDEVAVLRKTGKCMISKAKKYTESSDYLVRGDILVTASKGHTVVVLSNGKKSDAGQSRTCGDAEAEFQRFCNKNYSSLVKIATGKSKLVEDGEYGPKTRAVAVAIFKYMANKYFNAKLTVGNANFLSECRNIAYLMGDEEIAAHPTLGYLVQGILAGRAYFKGEVNGRLDDDTVEAVKHFQQDKGLGPSGVVTGSTWYRLFNS